MRIKVILEDVTTLATREPNVIVEDLIEVTRNREVSPGDRYLLLGQYDATVLEKEEGVTWKVAHF